VLIGAFGSMLFAMSLEVSRAEQRSEPDPVASQVRKLLDEGAPLEAHRLIVDPQSPELVYLQYRAEAAIGAATDAEASFLGGEKAPFLEYVKSHESDYRYSESLSSYRLSQARIEHFFRRLRDLEPPSHLINSVKLEILDEDFRSSAEGGYVMSDRDREQMLALRTRYAELADADGVDAKRIRVRISQIDAAIERFDQTATPNSEKK